MPARVPARAGAISQVRSLPGSGGRRQIGTFGRGGSPGPGRSVARMSEPVEPDTKDWTWVLEHPCPECGFDAAAHVPATIGATVRATIPRWQTVLTRVDVRNRPRSGVWSPLEYGCHVRDVFATFGIRIDLMLQTEAPIFEDWDQDLAALDGEYPTQDPAEVSEDLAIAGNELADSLDRVSDSQWDRPGHRSNGSEFTVATLAQYLLHDVLHHLQDVNG
jgi:hypothetical protein